MPMVLSQHLFFHENNQEQADNISLSEETKPVLQSLIEIANSTNYRTSHWK